MNTFVFSLYDDERLRYPVGHTGRAETGEVLSDALLAYDFLTGQAALGRKIFVLPENGALESYTLAELKTAGRNLAPAHDPRAPFAGFEITQREMSLVMDRLLASWPGLSDSQVAEDATTAYYFLVRRAAEKRARVFVGPDENHMAEIDHPALKTARNLSVAREAAPAPQARAKILQLN